MSFRYPGLVSRFIWIVRKADMGKLKVLVVSNLYPPYYIGGYELGCRDVVEGLRTRGHEVKVLTSVYGVWKPQTDGDIYRWLETTLERYAYTFLHWSLRVAKNENANQRAFKRFAGSFKPDVVYLWNLTTISLSLAFMAQRMGLPTCYFVSDHWLSCWEKDPWYSLCNHPRSTVTRRAAWRALRCILKASGALLPSGFLDLHHVQFASRYLKQHALQYGQPVGGAKVIPWSVDVDLFAYKARGPTPRRLLYVGQIVHHKGVHTAVQALQVLVQQYGHRSITLTIVGGTHSPSYEAHVRRLASSLGMEGHIHFTGLIPRECLPPIYQAHDILLFPSIREEPFSITLLEGMSSGLAIVGTATGGSAEILQHEVNALVFPGEDSQACAAQVLRLLDDHELFERIRQNGRRTIEEKYKLTNMMDAIESALLEVVTA